MILTEYASRLQKEKCRQTAVGLIEMGTWGGGAVLWPV
jgi:hypothetical protein